jgi:aminoglycoside 6'-N-acetyltransferase
VDGSRERARAIEPLSDGDLVIRAATLADVDLLCSWHADPEVVRFWDGKTFTPQQMVERLTGRPHVDPYIVETAGDPVGYVHAWFQGEDTGIDMFLVPTARGRGLGPAAARLLVRHLLGAGRDEVTVDPYLWNVRALASWRRAGFRALEERAPDDDHTAAWLLMVFDPETL